MFDKLKQMGTLASLFQNKDKLREAGERIRNKAEEVRATGEGGGGAVTAVVDGKMKVISIELTPALATGMAGDERTRELAGSLIADAVNAAQASAHRMMHEIIQREAEEMGLGEFGDELGKLMGS